MNPVEHDIECPFCGEVITIVIDPSQDHQCYIEDCSVCCRPILLTVACSEGEILSVMADRS